MRTILLVKDNGQRENRYVIDRVARRWEARGYRVISHRGVDELPEADVAILHVDKTRVPAEYYEAVCGYPVVLNHNVLDISKRRISSNLLDRRDDYSGPVIVKTDANCGGKADRLSRRADGDAASRKRRSIPLALYRMAWRRIHGRPRWIDITWLQPKRYPIYPSPEAVPSGVWKNPHLIVEKFVPEKEGDLYFVRYYMFLGGSGWCGRFGAKSPIVKFENIATHDERIPVPRELRELRHRLGVDYGRFDYVEHNGRVMVLDVNKTVGAVGNRPDLAPYVDYLAEGIEEFFPHRSTEARDPGEQPVAMDPS